MLTLKIRYWKGYAISLSFMAFLKSFVPFKFYELCSVLFLEQPWIARYWAITFDIELIPLRIYSVAGEPGWLSHKSTQLSTSGS